MIVLSSLQHLLLNDSNVSQSWRWRLLVAASCALFAGIWLSYLAQHFIGLANYPYDVDGWGHVIGKVESGSLGCDYRFDDAYNPYRGFLLPILFAESYCLLGMPEAVQVLNVVLHMAATFIFVYYFAMAFSSLLLPALTAIAWALWPAYDFLHGYYFSEQIGGLLLVIAVVLLLSLLRAHGWQRRQLWQSLWLALTLALLINVRSAALLFVAAVTLWVIVLIIKRAASVRHALVFSVSLGVLLSIQPAVNYSQLQAFVPFTTQGGFALHEGTYLPGDDQPASYLRQIPEFNQREAGTQGMSPVQQNAYWKGLAMANIKADPQGQLVLLSRKLLRFWINLPAHQWIPTTKSLIVGLPLLLLWLMVLAFHQAPLLRPLLLATLSIWLMHGAIHSEYRYSYVVFPMTGLACLLFVRERLAILAKRSGMRSDDKD